jgi:hypothetical protein
METSQQTDKIIPAFVAAQAAMEGAKKDSQNLHFKSRYADLESVMQACRAALKENGLAVFQTTDAEGRTLATRIYHTSGQGLESVTPLIVGKQDMQGFGSAVTYARRYALMAALGIAPEDDDGNEAAKHPAQPRTAPNQQRNPAATGQATKYVDTQIKHLGTIASKEEYESWRDAVDDRLKQLKNGYQAEYDRLVAVMNEVQAKFTQPVAAE